MRFSGLLVVGEPAAFALKGARFAAYSPIMPAKLLALLFTLASAALLPAADDYKLGPDSQPQPSVPRGQVSMAKWESKIFPGTVRDYWVYVPAQYDAGKPACVMIFQDGNNYQKTNGEFRVPIV